MLIRYTILVVHLPYSFLKKRLVVARFTDAQAYNSL